LVEQFAALADKWRKAEEINDYAAAEAFEDELHARVGKDEIRNLKLTDCETGELSSTMLSRRSDTGEHRYAVEVFIAALQIFKGKQSEAPRFATVASHPTITRGHISFVWTIGRVHNGAVPGR
jgi:hypothetical protein